MVYYICIPDAKELVLMIHRYVTALCCFGATVTLPTFAADREISVILDREPKEVGIVFDRSHVTPIEFTAEDGRKQHVWAAQYGSNPDAGWGRTMRFVIKDAAFKNGARPAVDVEIEYMLDAWGGVDIFADTKSGTRRIGSGWGGSKRWQKVSFRIDDAYFGERAHQGKPGENETLGFDIGINGINSDLLIRSIKIKGYDLDTNVNYARMMKLDGIETANDLLLFRPNKQESLTYRFVNLARRPLDVSYTLAMSDFGNKPVLSRKGAIHAAGSAETRIPFTIPTTGLKNGVYRVRLVVQEKSAKGVPDKTILERESYLGVASPTKLTKAKPGEFLFGLDAQLGSVHNYPRLLKWSQIMGADIVRGFDDSNNWAQTKSVLDTLASYGLQTSLINGPEWDADANRRKERVAEKAKYFEELARRFPAVKYFELGNEPDLLSFYRGDIKTYAGDYAILYDAIKRGNPNAVVMNGGLSFAGEEGKKRSREFVELVDASKIDAWAYHGHGIGAKAERDALTRMQATAREFGKGDKPYIETESGVAARTPAQEVMQARTAVQKLVYAQSAGLPFLHWFRLLMFEEDYGNLRTDQEPRPAVLSYRATVEALRGYKFDRMVETGVPDVFAYQFQQNGGNGRVCVLWTEKPIDRTVTLAVGSGKVPVAPLTVRDMFGNPASVPSLPDGTVQIVTGESPVFLSWTTTEPAFATARAAPVLSLPTTAQIVPGTPSTVTVTVRNPLGRPLKATLTTAANATGTPFTATPGRSEIVLKAGETKRVPLAVTLGGTTGIEWPRMWSVFVYSDADGADVTSVPQTLPKENKGGTVMGQRIPLRDNKFDFTRLGGTVRERAPAVVVGEVVSNRDQTVRIGASADWYMAWHVNGRKIYDTLANGNGAFSGPTDHMFDLPLKKGRNVLVANVQSGSQGWLLQIGDPEMAKRAAGAGNGKNTAPHLTLTLSEGGKPLARETVQVEYALPIAPLPSGLSLAAPIAQWQTTDPVAVLGANSLRNFFEKEPDSSRWWKGDDDLSGEAWLFSTPDTLILTVRVRDANPATGDSVQVGIGRDEKSFGVYTVAGNDAGGAVVTKQSGVDGAITASVERGAGTAVYKLRINRAALSLTGAGEVRVNLLVSDSDDGKTRKQALTWTPGLLDETNPALWHRAALTP